MENKDGGVWKKKPESVEIAQRGSEIGTEAWKDG